MQPFGDFQYGQMAPTRRLMVPHQRGQRVGQASKMRPLSLPPSLFLSLSLSPYFVRRRRQSVIRVGRRRFVSRATIPAALPPPTIASSVIRIGGLKNYCGIEMEMKVRPGIHPSQFAFAFSFCTIKYALEVDLKLFGFIFFRIYGSVNLILSPLVK